MFKAGKKNKKILKFFFKNKKLIKVIIPVFVLFLLFFIFILKDLPSPTRLSSSELPQSTQIFDRNGVLLYTIYARKNQTFVPLSIVPKQVRQAAIAIEDKDFYLHGPIDIKGIIRSIFAIATRHQIQGGSTITQQLVKNSLLTPERTILRKIKEILLSFATEALYPKDKILELYLNQTPYGGTAWGIEAAAQTYFGKHVKDLTLSESALLAGLPEAPTTFSPFGAHPELAKKRQEEVLRKMYEQKYITRNQMENAIKEPLLYQKFSDRIKAPHFVLYVKDLLTNKYGEKVVEEGGLKVTTSLDLKIQDFSQSTVAAEIAQLENYHVTNGAALITNPATGEILSMIGSRDYFDNKHDGNVNVALALRQPGSSIKPINYAVGLMHGYTAATPFVDQKTCFSNPGHPDYCPVNYDGKFHGVVQMRFALANSINIPAIKMLKLNGIPSMLATASAMGITTFKDPQRYGLSLTLGGGEVTMLDMTEAFGVFANSGYRVPLHPILKVVDNKGKILEEYQPPKSPIFGKKVLPEEVAYIISSILSDNNARSMEFGTNSPLRINDLPVAVKTGTTNDFRDNWTIGYTPSFVVAVWVGNNDNTPMSGLTSGITGAAPIWHDLMQNLLKNKPPAPFQRPENIVQKAVCTDSGLIPSTGSAEKCPTRFEYFIKKTESTQISLETQKVWVDKTTQDLPKPGQTDNLELKDETIIKDPTGDSYCLTCPHPTPTPSP
ncbi:transglycosylase domain-containing protein [Patescibacteria group bacterium]|nr:transglycosylase domain-containing protein [Patescibacteria group bacterium]